MANFKGIIAISVLIVLTGASYLTASNAALEKRLDKEMIWLHPPDNTMGLRPPANPICNAGDTIFVSWENTASGKTYSCGTSVGSIKADFGANGVAGFDSDKIPPKDLEVKVNGQEQTDSYQLRKGDVARIWTKGFAALWD